MRSAWNAFLCVYFTLEYVYERSSGPGNGLREYLGDANPFLWADRGSADPAIWVEFERDFTERFPSGTSDDQELLAFVRDYLEKQGVYYVDVFPGGDETPFVDLFDGETNLTEWTRMLDDVERQERSSMRLLTL